MCAGQLFISIIKTHLKIIQISIEVLLNFGVQILYSNYRLYLHAVFFSFLKEDIGLDQEQVEGKQQLYIQLLEILIYIKWNMQIEKIKNLIFNL